MKIIFCFLFSIWLTLPALAASAQPRVGGVEVVRANGGLATNMVVRGLTNASATAPVHSVSGYTSGDGTENGFDGYIDVTTGNIFAITVTNVEQSVTNVFVGTWPLVPGWCWQIESTNNYLIRYTNGPCGGGGGSQIWTNDADGTITAVSSVPEGVGAVGFALNTDNPLVFFGATSRIVDIGSGGTNFFHIMPDGGVLTGRNIISAGAGGNEGDVFIAYRDIANGDVNNMTFQTLLSDTANSATARKRWNMEIDSYYEVASVANGADSSAAALNVGIDQIKLNYEINDISYTQLEPSADAKDPAYVFDTSLIHDAGNLLELRNNTTNKFFVTFDGTATANHFSGTTNLSPTIAAGAGAGTGPTVTIVGGDTAGYISIVSGTLPSVSSVIATVTFGTAYLDAPSVVLWPRNAAASVLTFLPFAVGGTTTWTFNAGTIGLGGSTTYEYNYLVMGTGNH